MLKKIASIFGHLEILSPTVVPLHILFQKISKEGSSWDDDVHNEDKAKLKKWSLSAQKTHNIVILRCYLQKEKPVEYKIIGYYDTSDKAYSAVNISK